MTWTTPEDITDRWIGEDQPSDTDQLKVLIGDAEATLKAEFPDLPDRVDSGELAQPVVAMVVARMVIRILQNPAGLRQTTESVGPFSTNMTFAGDTPGQFSLTDADRRVLGYEPTRSQAAFTVHPAYESVSCDPTRL